MTEKKNPFEDENKEEVVQDIAQEQEEIKEASDENGELNKKLEELNSQYIRLAADFDNYRKRQEQERQSLLKYGAENTLKTLLSVVDNFERAQKALIDVDDVEKVKESFNVVYKQFLESLERAGLKTIDTDGQKFDPNLHEAVMQTPSEDVENETIIAELQKGYMLEDRILRAALVNVAVNDK